jgi:hypothetical protein
MEAAAAACETPLLALIEAGVTFLDQVIRMLPRIGPEEKQEKAGDLANDLRNLEGGYQILKAELLEAGMQGRHGRPLRAAAPSGALCSRPPNQRSCWKRKLPPAFLKKHSKRFNLPAGA